MGTNECAWPETLIIAPVPWVRQTRLLNDDLTMGEVVSLEITLPVIGSPARADALIDISRALAGQGLRLVVDEEAFSRLGLEVPGAP